MGLSFMALNAIENSNSRLASAPAPTALTPLEAEAVELFVGLSQVVGLPKSVGQIYGLLYISHVLLSLDEVAARRPTSAS